MIRLFCNLQNMYQISYLLLRLNKPTLPLVHLTPPAPLRRLALERSTSAAMAVDIIAELLESHGQGGACSENEPDLTYHNSFLIADATEAWVLETAGKYWAAEQIKSEYSKMS